MSKDKKRDVGEELRHTAKELIAGSQRLVAETKALLKKIQEEARKHKK